MTFAEEIAEDLRDGLSNVTFANETDLQVAIGKVLHNSGWAAVREVRLSDGKSRIDLMVGERPDAVYGLQVAGSAIGIEVKVDGSLASVLRQLDRYAACTEISELILVTSRAGHSRIPDQIGARRIPLHLVTLIENGL